MKYLVTLLLLVSSCEYAREVSSEVDKKAFEIFSGKTVFGRPEAVSLKEIHLNSETLYGNSVVVEGEVLAVGEYDTHLVISDSTARMLILLTSLSPDKKFGDELVGKRLKILGDIQDGKKGLPIVKARSVHVPKMH